MSLEKAPRGITLANTEEEEETFSIHDLVTGKLS
jgi:hypothetical protein